MRELEEALLRGEVVIEEVDLGAQAEPPQLLDEEAEVLAERVSAHVGLEQEALACLIFFVRLVGDERDHEQRDRDHRGPQVDQDRRAREALVRRGEAVGLARDLARGGGERATCALVAE